VDLVDLVDLYVHRVHCVLGRSLTHHGRV